MCLGGSKLPPLCDIDLSTIQISNHGEDRLSTSLRNADTTYVYRFQRCFKLALGLATVMVRLHQHMPKVAVRAMESLSVYKCKSVLLNPYRCTSAKPSPPANCSGAMHVNVSWVHSLTEPCRSTASRSWTSAGHPSTRGSSHHRSRRTS